tara:strand:- start:1287 stop:3089 length:1803 start_codon:yes stop_codon:yes gene_type:complete
MINKLLILTVLMASSIVRTNADTVIELDTPNPGDTSTTITYTTGTVTTTNNLISQVWNDGSWVGTQFPDSSDLSENIFVTGKHQKYLETTVSSIDLMTEAEVQQGFTSTFGVQARWWNNQASTFTMYQTALDNLGNHTKQSTVFKDTTNHNYQFNPYANTLIIAPNENLTHGNITAGFNFDIQGSATYNGGHVGVDLRSPTLTIDYQTLSQTSVTTIEYCYEKNPPTCPGQDEIDAVDNIIDNIDVDNIVEDIIIDEIDTYVPETILYIPDEIELDEVDYYEVPPITFEVAYVPDVETIILIDTPDIETNIDMDMPDIPLDDYVDIGMPEDVDMEMFDMEAVDTDELVSMFTSEPEIIEEAPVEEITEPVMMAATEPETISEPEPEPIPEDKPMQETVMEEEPVNEPEPETKPEVEEQSSSEELIADEPTPEPDNPQQEETVEEPVEAEAKPEPEPAVEEDIEPEIVEEKPEVKIDVAKIEQAIKEQVTNKIQQIAATLDVVSEVLSREMSAQEPDMSSYTALNAAMIDNRQLPGGNPAFFNEISLESYNKTIYNDPTKIIAMIGVDPVIEHTQKVNKARNKTNEAYFILKGLLEAQNVQ